MGGAVVVRREALDVRALEGPVWAAPIYEEAVLGVLRPQMLGELMFVRCGARGASAGDA